MYRKRTLLSGHTIEVSTEEIVEKTVVLCARLLRQYTYRSTERVHNILHENLKLKRLCARWVPRLLKDDQ